MKHSIEPRLYFPRISLHIPVHICTAYVSGTEEKPLHGSKSWKLLLKSLPQIQNLSNNTD